LLQTPLIELPGFYNRDAMPRSGERSCRGLSKAAATRARAKSNAAPNLRTIRIDRRPVEAADCAGTLDLWST